MIIKFHCEYCGNKFLHVVEGNQEKNTRCPACGAPMELDEIIRDKELVEVPGPAVPYGINIYGSPNEYGSPWNEYYDSTTATWQPTVSGSTWYMYSGDSTADTTITI